MSTTPGQSFRDPIYDNLDARFARKYGLPNGGAAALRTRGERSNANQVSSAGARTVYQIMPNTRSLFIKKYGVDAYSSPEGAAEVAALHLKESLERNNGDWTAAVGEYHGGPNRANWGPVNRAYRARVTGHRAGDVAPEVRTASSGPPPHISFEDAWSHSPDELISRRPSRDGPMPSVQDRINGMLGNHLPAPVDLTPVQAEKGMGEAAIAEQRKLDSYTPWDHVKAGWSEGLTAHLIHALGENENEYDPAFMADYKRNWQTIEGFAKSDAEVSQLREATSAYHLEAIKEDILAKRHNEEVISSAASPTGLRLGTGLLDPAGFAAGFGVGKAAQLAGVGSAAMIAAGRPVTAIASAGIEGAVGNLAVTAGLDASGDYVSPEEYGMSALTGLGIGAALGAIGIGREAIQFNESPAATAQRQVVHQMRREAAGQLGDSSTPEAIQANVQERLTKGYRDALEFALADVPADQKLMVAGDVLTADPAARQRMVDAYDLAKVSDDTDRARIAETVARAERIDAANTIDTRALQTFLAKIGQGQESTAARLLQSESPVGRAVGLTLLESAQGAGGRRRSAAIILAQRERVYNEQFSEYNDLMQTFRKQEGISRAVDHWSGDARNAFSRRVFAELEGRQSPTHVPDASPLVVRAATVFENGMDAMRLDQQHVGTVGAARLGNSSVGYVPHRLDPRQVLSLTREQTKRVRGLLSAQFQDIEGFDAEFADKLASKYLERAVDGAAGRYHVPFNLHSPEAGQIVRDALEGMNLGADELDKIIGKFSRGGASHTKQRLRLDLSADIGDGKKLGDLFVNDVQALYRSYSRRVAGEVALAQYGVMGAEHLRHLSKAMTATGASPADIKAFDQVAAEFLNTPFGEHNHKWMDNLRIATTVSRLGGMGFTQLAEFGNAIPAVGIQGAIKGVASMPRLISEVRGLVSGKGAPSPILGSIDQLGGTVGADDYHMTRMFDVRDNDVELYSGESAGVVSRSLRSAAHANTVLTGHRMILAGQMRSMSEQIVRKAVRYAKDGTNDTALRDMGFTDELLAAIKSDMGKIATFDSKGKLESLDLFKGSALKPHMVAEIAQSVERGASQIIQRAYVGETGAWAHDGFLKLLAQFRTFSITSVEKQWGRNVKNYGALKSFMYLMAAASFALPIHLARMETKMLGMPADKRKEYWEQNSNPIALSRATLNYASSAGLAGDIMDVGASFASNWGGDFGEKFGDAYSARGKRTDQLVGGVIAPGAGLAQDVYKGIMQGDLKSLSRSLPGSNLPYVTPFVTAALHHN